MRSFEYVLVDVFTREALKGNQLAVFVDGRGLSTAEMQAVAKEMNLAETTFILPGEGKEGAQRVRIFTVDEELPFAGHPTLGTANVLRGQTPGAEAVTLELQAGRIAVRFTEREGAAFGEMQQLDPKFGQVHERAAVAQAAGLAVEAIATEWPVQTVSTGMPFAIVPLASQEALRGLNLNWKQASAYLETTDAKFFYFVARENGEFGSRFAGFAREGAGTPERSENALEARMIFYNGEDPATGSAAGCCIAWCVKHGVIAAEAQAVIHQGAMARRPSEIFVRAGLDNRAVKNVRVGGYSVVLGGGALRFS